MSRFPTHTAMQKACLAAPLVLWALTGRAADTGVPADTEWALLGNGPDMQHHSNLAQINRKTIPNLGLAWAVDMPTRDGLIGNPLVSNGRIFQSGAHSRIFANDLRTGKLLWTHEPLPVGQTGTLSEGFGLRINRGVALHDDLVIVGTADCRLVAVDQETGEQRWEAQACETEDSEVITAAPRVGGGMVFTGNGCLDMGVSRGHVDAFDASTGRRLWRFYTVPGDPHEPPENELYREAAMTWGDDWYAKTRGCGSVWDAMTYDDATERLYIGTGGSAPLAPTQRGEAAGDELYTNSIVALDAKTGDYLWHFKQTPQEGWNYEAAVGIMLATLPVWGEERRVVISVPKDGFVYLLDADTGEFLSGRNYVPVNWAKGLDEQGRPIYEPAARYWERPGSKTVVNPGGLGAHGWEALAFDPVRNLLFIPSMTMPTLYETYTGSGGVLAEMGVTVDAAYGSRDDPDWQAFGEVVAWDPVSQTELWRQRHALPMNGGLLHTAGGLVFQGSAEGYFTAYHSGTGEQLWSAAAGGAIRGAPSTVMADGHQFIVVASGNGSTSIGGSGFPGYSSVPRSRSQPRLLAFALGGRAPTPPWAIVPTIPKPQVAPLDAALAYAGYELFSAYGCSSCHGHGGEALGATATDLRLRPPLTAEYLRMSISGVLKSRGMPSFDLTGDEVKALHAYLVNTAWNAYETQ